MKIVQVLIGLQSGGAERLVVDLSNELSAQGHDVTLMLLKDITLPGRDFYLKDVEPRVKVRQLGLADGLHPLYLFKAHDAIVDEHPDVVHVHQGSPYMLYAMQRLHNRILFVYTIHTDITKAFSGDLKDRLAFRYMLRWAAPRYGIPYVAISQKNYDDMRRVYPKVPTHLVYNGRKTLAPSRRFDAVKREIDALKHTPFSTVLLHVARCHTQKNQRLLIDTFNRLVDEDLDAELVVIGDGFFDTPRGDELRSVSCDRIHYLGTRNNIGDYFMQVDAFVLSSVAEGMPITLLEAMQCGLPVLTTPVCGGVDVVRSGYNGVISDDFSEEKYAAAMREFFRNFEKLSQAAKQEALTTPYSISNTARGYLQIYEAQSLKNRKKEC